MHTSQKFLIVALLVLSFAVRPAQGQGAQITDITANGWTVWQNLTTYYPIHVVNGDGLSGNSHANNPVDTMWRSGQNGTIANQRFVIDLKADYDLAQTGTMRVWNYNEAGLTSLGIRTATFSYKADDGAPPLSGGNSTSLPAGTFTPIPTVTSDAGGGHTFDQADGLATYSSFNTINFNTPITCRYIKIQPGSNHAGVTFGEVGLSELQVFKVSGATAMPGTLIYGK